MNRNCYERGTVPVNEQKLLRSWHYASQWTDIATIVALCQSMNRHCYERGTVPVNEQTLLRSWHCASQWTDQWRRASQRAQFQVRKWNIMFTTPIINHQSRSVSVHCAVLLNLLTIFTVPLSISVSLYTPNFRMELRISFKVSSEREAHTPPDISLRPRPAWEMR